MAKEKRIQISLKCKDCGSINYWSEKNKENTQDKLELKKFCSNCRKHTQHLETKPKNK